MICKCGNRMRLIKVSSNVFNDIYECSDCGRQNHGMLPTGEIIWTKPIVKVCECKKKCPICGGQIEKEND